MPEPVSTSALFAWLFVTVSLFFASSSARYRGRGYGYLSLTFACVAFANAANACFYGGGQSQVGFLAARLGSVVGLVAAAFNAHFLYSYFNATGRKRVTWLLYLLVGAAALVSLASTAASLPRWQSVAYPDDYISPSHGMSLSAVGIMIVYYALVVPLLLRSRRAQAPYSGRILVTILATAPATLADVAVSHFWGQRWFLAEACTWLYALVVFASLIAEIQGAEGLLHETTQELESSYAEMDLMASELSRKQQLAAVGELAASIAHEVRNPLAIIMNATSGLRRPTLAAEDRRTLLDIVNEESERLNHLVEELLRFARPVIASPGPVSLLDMCVRMSQSPPDGYNLVVTKEQDASLGPVLVDPGLFRLALDNLIANACQAMPGGGRIELSVDRGSFSDGTHAARVRVRDFGRGMTEDELERARKPFFTTKPRGTGLGLPIVDRIVEAHGGEMEIESEVSEGTSVQLLLPLEKELNKTATLSGGRTASARRRLRSIPPGVVGEADESVGRTPNVEAALSERAPSSGSESGSAGADKRSETAMAQGGAAEAPLPPGIDTTSDSRNPHT